MNNIFRNKRILSIDYGLNKIGLAYTDELHISINYLPFILNDDKLFDNLKYIIEKNKIDEIILGYTIIKNNDKFKNSLDKFYTFIKENINSNVLKYDESNTTEEAYKIIYSSSIKKNNRKDYKDSIAAGVILKNFLDDQL